jgi:hypothetical protein
VPTNPQKRVAVSGKLRLKVFQEAYSTCPFCGLEKLGSLQVHHIDGDPGNENFGNLIAACGSCHDQITKGFKSEADVRTAKRMLESGAHPFRQPPKHTGDSVNVSHSSNSGIIANRVTINSGDKRAKIILPGTIGADPPRYNYVEYLIKQLTKFRQAGASYGQRRGKIHSGSVRKILDNELGGLPKDQPVDRFDDIVAVLKSKIGNTALGRNNTSRGIRNYHEFEEHGRSKSR